MDMNDQDFHWLSGLLEGEGSFLKTSPSESNKPKISIQMTDLDIIQRVANLFGVSATYIKSRNPKHKDSYSAKVTGLKAVELMKRLYPFMGSRRKQQIEAALKTFDLSTLKRKPVKLTKEQAEWCIRELPNSSLRKLGKELGVNHETVRAAIKRYTTQS